MGDNQRIPSDSAFRASGTQKLGIVGDACWHDHLQEETFATRSLCGYLEQKAVAYGKILRFVFVLLELVLQWESFAAVI